MKQIDYPDFTGKVVIVYTGVENGAALINAQFERQADRVFLVGTIVEGSSAGNWLAGVHYAVAWDTVHEYGVFESVDNYLARIRLSPCWPVSGAANDQ